MTFMPTRNTRTERDDLEQFFIDLDAKPAHDGEWRKLGQWNKDGSLRLYQQGEALTDRSALAILATFAHEVYIGAIRPTEMEHAARTALMRTDMLGFEKVSALAMPDCGEYGHDKGVCGNAQCLAATPKAAPADPRTDPAWEQRTSDYAEGYRDGKAEPAAVSDELLDAMRDMLNGWKYIRRSHGDLYGVGWDRAQDKMEKAIAALSAQPAEAPSDSAKPATPGELAVRYLKGFADGRRVDKEALGKGAAEPTDCASCKGTGSDGMGSGCTDCLGTGIDPRGAPKPVAWRYLRKASKGDCWRLCERPLADEYGDYHIEPLYLHPSSGAQAAGQEDAEAMRMLWDDQPLEEKEHYRRAASGGATA